MKHFSININNINTNVNNNNNNNVDDIDVNNTNDVNNNTNDDVDDTYDGKIRDKISDIRVILSRLGVIITKNDREKIKKELYKIEKRKNHSDDNLVELVNKLNEKEKYRYHDRDP